MVIIFKSNLKSLIARTGTTTVLFSVIVKLTFIKQNTVSNNNWRINKCLSIKPRLEI